LALPILILLVYIPISCGPITLVWWWNDDLIIVFIIITLCIMHYSCTAHLIGGIVVLECLIFLLFYLFYSGNWATELIFFAFTFYYIYLFIPCGMVVNMRRWAGHCSGIGTDILADDWAIGIV